jgi:hypothetical protein
MVGGKVSAVATTSTVESGEVCIDKTGLLMEGSEARS